MQQRVEWIVGASSGIGLSVARKEADAGNVVYGGSRRDCPDERVTSLQMDASKPRMLQDGLQRILDETGRIDALVYSAGFSMAAPVEYAQEEDYRYLFEVNFFGALECIRLVLPHMRAQGYGRIALVGSMGGVLPIAYDAFYSASKAALITLSKELNMEVNPYGVYSSVILPGGTATRFTFKRKVYPAECVGEYGADLDKSVGALAGIEQGGMEADEVADTIIKTLNAQKPPLVVASGAKNKAYYLSQKILPQKFTQYLVENTYNLH